RAMHARLSLYDVSGQLVATLIDGTVAPAGEVTWDRRTLEGKRAVAGVYWADFRSDGVRISRKVVLMR
ncbi:MAG TPA: hypothetical protein VKU85_05965, partial [bacterium]|nr:hypothetical protein [bacterium]